MNIQALKPVLVEPENTLERSVSFRTGARVCWARRRSGRCCGVKAHRGASLPCTFHTFRPVRERSGGAGLLERENAFQSGTFRGHTERTEEPLIWAAWESGARDGRGQQSTDLESVAVRSVREQNNNYLPLKTIKPQSKCKYAF